MEAGRLVCSLRTGAAFQRRSHRMRILSFLALSILALLALDAIAFDGRYREQAWRETARQGDKFNHEMKSLLRRFGLGG